MCARRETGGAPDFLLRRERRRIQIHEDGRSAVQTDPGYAVCALGGIPVECGTVECDVGRTVTCRGPSIRAPGVDGARNVCPEARVDDPRISLLGAGVWGSDCRLVERANDIESVDADDRACRCGRQSARAKKA